MVKVTNSVSSLISLLCDFVLPKLSKVLTLTSPVVVSKPYSSGKIGSSTGGAVIDGGGLSLETPSNSKSFFVSVRDSPKFFSGSEFMEVTSAKL